MTYSHFVVPYQTVWNACILLITQKVKSSMLYERRQTQHESFFRELVSICKISSNFSRVCIFTFLLWIENRMGVKIVYAICILGCYFVNCWFSSEAIDQVLYWRSALYYYDYQFELRLDITADYLNDVNRHYCFSML